jgi:hypothetical protein
MHSRRPPFRRLLLAIALVCCAGTASATIVSGQSYTLTSGAGGMLLDNGGQTDTGRMGQWTPVEGNTNQQWRLEALGGDVYMLLNLTSGMALDDGGTGASGAVVTQYAASTTNLNQQWHLVSAGIGIYRLVNAASGKALDSGDGPVAGDPVRQTDVSPGSASQAWAVTPVQIGARTAFTTYEGETGTLLGGATITALLAPPTTRFSSAELEASGHAFVHLGAIGQQVTWINTTGKPMTAFNLRYSIPDAAAGGGIDRTLNLYVNGKLRQAIPVTSRQTWLYETQDDYDSMDQAPSHGSPHVFWDEVHAFVTGAPIAPGDTVTLRKDVSNTAAWYDVDLLELEAPPSPVTRTPDSLSIIDCGAVPNNPAVDSTNAIQLCFDQARDVGKSVWIPPGTFYLNTSRGLESNGITIEGAGMWYSTIYYNPPLGLGNTNNVFAPTSTTLRNFAIDGNAVDLTPAGGNGGAINIKGSNWLIDSLWIQHEGAGVWADGDDGIVQKCRINNTWADGINLNNGNGEPGNDSGSRLTARNNFIRGSGDDGLAINDGGAPAHPMQDVSLVNNTVVAPWWANNIGVYGGNNDIVANNLAQDSVKQFGISVGRFGQNGGLNAAWVEGNAVIRGGSNGYGIKFPAIGLGTSGTVDTVQNIVFRGNSVRDAMFDGMHLSSQSAAWVQNTTMSAPGLGGYIIENDANGSGTLWYNHLDGLKPGQPGFVGNPASFQIETFGNDGLGIP